MLVCGKFRFDFSRPLIMGIVNVTPDSFSDGGRDSQAAIGHALRLAEAGADILDVGGESTRPGSEPVPVEIERARILPVIEALARENLPVSVDTMKPEVMKDAISAGASMINDVTALQSGDCAFLAESDVAVCLMHMQGEPRSMQDAPRYGDVVDEVDAFLAERIRAAIDSGIQRARLVIDPGFGFGKTLAQNMALLRHLDRFSAHGVPILAGLSRKSMLGALTGRPVGERGHASVAASLLALERGADIVRVHDVAAMRDAVTILNALRG